MITQERLKELLHYDTETGIFTWVSVKGNMKPGMIAGRTNADGYIVIKIDSIPYMAHRLAWLYCHGSMPTNFIDHINSIKNDNRKINLREATKQQNNHNKIRPNKDNTSGYLGVSYHKVMRKFAANITKNNRMIHLGYFDDPAIAHQAYLKAKRELHEYCTI